ncbi:type II toxin-antitoxin system RelE/ParE family toxin [Paludisphaera rhizosphaerae]|uniref:type II toxin-antitoxin system RelE/ParE family toxin n=1 Tax=Paludisphaera rhizosphaerae TaxID=2711216 RepID=UPI0013EC0740|nr:type II toxin-antitoxin system RelE/ParE family toxin [Paludisphaera rhizosphaerae]
MTEVKIHPEAEAEYEHALGWYLDRSSQAAARFEAAFDEAIQAIRSHPEMFPRCDEVHRYVLLRRFPYSLIYRVEGESATIFAVAHSKRRTGYWSGRA